MQDMRAYNHIIRQLRRFFQDTKGFIEVPAQSRLSILAACEDPKTISQFAFSGINYPLPQTGQMWLEAEILKNPDVPGVFCSTTSYRNEPKPIPGRHEKIFPMFEFEAAGDMKTLKKLEAELLEFLGFPAAISCIYDDICEQYSIDEISAEYELRLSIIPTLYGENIVIRILSTKMLFSMSDLGMDDTHLKILEKILAKPHGIIFVTGPTGSGKTTTLYTCLSQLNTRERKIITIEDPV